MTRSGHRLFLLESFAASDALHDHPAIPYRSDEQTRVRQGHGVHSPFCPGDDCPRTKNSNQIANDKKLRPANRKAAATPSAVFYRWLSDWSSWCGGKRRRG